MCITQELNSDSANELSKSLLLTEHTSPGNCKHAEKYIARMDPAPMSSVAHFDHE